MPHIIAVPRGSLSSSKKIPGAYVVAGPPCRLPDNVLAAGRTATSSSSFTSWTWLLLGAYVFRRLAGDRYPICSWLVAHSFKKARLFFGVEADEAQPDDIWDFAQQNPGRYREFRPLELL